MAIFRFLKMAAGAILDFSDFILLTVRLLKRAELRRRAKFGRNRSIHGRDMPIFRFFQDGGRPPSWICYVCVRTTHEGHLVVFIAVQILVGIEAVVLLATAIPSVCPSVCLSVCLSVRHTPVLCQNDGT